MQCPSCKSASPDEVRFCLHCGHYLGEPDESTLIRPSPVPSTSNRADEWQRVVDDYDATARSSRSVPSIQPTDKPRVTWTFGVGGALLASILLLAIGAI